MCGKVVTFLTVPIGLEVLTVLTVVKVLTVLKVVIVLTVLTVVKFLTVLKVVTVLTAYVEFHLISTYHSKDVIMKSYWRNATVKWLGGTRLDFKF